MVGKRNLNYLGGNHGDFLNKTFYTISQHINIRHLTTWPKRYFL